MNKVPSIDFLEVGDLVYYKNGNDIIENAIEAIGNNELYHHTAMIIGNIFGDNKDKIIIESQMIKGVHLDFLSQNKDDFDVYRIENGLEVEEKNELIKLAKQYNNLPYDYFGAGKNIPYLSWLFKNFSKRYYCNELVGRMYKDINREIKYNKIPNSIVKNKNFIKIYDSLKR